MTTVNTLLDALDWTVLLGAAIRILLILIALWVVSWLAGKALERFRAQLAKSGSRKGKQASEQAKRADTLTHLLRQLVRIAVVVVGALVILKGRIKTWPVYQWEVGRELLRRVKRAFDAEGIEIPFPQRTLHLRQEGSPLERALQEQADAGP